MDKHAAEKIASDYYNMGMQLALDNAGLTKHANKGLAALLGGGAAVGGAGALKHINPEILAQILKPGELAAQKASPHVAQAMEYLSNLKSSLL